MKYRDQDEVDEWELIYPEDIDDLEDLDDLDEDDEDDEGSSEDDDFDSEDHDFEEEDDDDFEDEDDDSSDDDASDDDSSDFDSDDEVAPVAKPKPAAEKSKTRRVTSRSLLIDEEADACEEAIDYEFKDRRMLEHGLTHSSIARTRLESNERLEFLGDSIMGAVICEALYNQFPDLPEGEMTRIKSAVVSRQTCAKVAQKLKLNRFLLLGKGFPSRDRLPGSIIAAAYEAMVASIYLDGGFEAAKKFVLDTMRDEVSKTARSAHAENFKSLLQHLGQKYYGHTPNYRVVDEKGPDHSKCFEIAVTIGGRVFPSAWGPSKKEAEQNAARAAIQIIGEEKNEVFD